MYGFQKSGSSLMAKLEEGRFPHISIVGGPEPGSLKIFRDGKELRSVVEFQINGGTEQAVTAIFKEIITFDGSIDLMPERKIDSSTH